MTKSDERFREWWIGVTEDGFGRWLSGHENFAPIGEYDCVEKIHVIEVKALDTLKAENEKYNSALQNSINQAYELAGHLNAAEKRVAELEELVKIREQQISDLHFQRGDHYLQKERDELKAALNVARETILSVKLTSSEGSEKWQWCDETLKQIDEVLGGK